MHLPKALQKLKLRSKLLTSFLAVGLVPFAIITFMAIIQANRALNKQAFGQLLSMRDVKKAQVETYMQTMKDQIITFSEDHMIVDAMTQLSRDFMAFTRENNLSSTQISDLRNKLATYYSGDFSAEYRKRNDNRSPDVSRIINQIDDTSVALQYYYIKANPHPLGSKLNLDRAQDESQFSRSHAHYHPVIRDFLNKFGYYDIFLVEPNTGRIVYTVFKELDFTTSLIDGPYAQTNIGEAFRLANASTTAESVVITDYKQYLPSYEDPAGFIASPIFKDGKKIGVLMFQFPIDRLNAIMTTRAGMGKTGETYLVGDDLLMRSDSYLDPENHSVVNSFKHPDKGRVETEASRGALSGKSGEKIITDYNGNPVLSAFSPIQFEGLKWALIAEIDEAEAFASITLLKEITGVVAVVCIAVIVGLALLITRGIVGPVQSLAQAMNIITSENDLTVEVAVTTQDETMAGQFNTMMEKLRNTLKLVTNAASDVNEHANEVAQRAMANKERAENQEKQMQVMQQTVAEMGGTAGEVAKASEQQKDAANLSSETVDNLLKGMEMVAESTGSQISEANQAAERVQEMGETGGKVVELAGKQGEAVERVTQAVNQMAEKVKEMTEVAARSTEYGRQVLSAAEEGAQSVNATVEGMRAIAESSDQISEIITVITDIAEQTNLLSLNAAIEAARAGAHGKGFAVVADEVGKLAQRSSEAAKEITQLIKDSTARVAEGTNLTDRSQEALKRIAEGGQINMKAIEDISDVVQILAETTQSVNDMMSQLNTLALEIAGMGGQQGKRREAARNALATLVEKSNEISESVEKAHGGALQISSEMLGIVSRTDEMNQMTDLQAGRSKTLVEITTQSAEAAKQTVLGAGTVVGITDEMRKLSEALTEQVNQFKVE